MKYQGGLPRLPGTSAVDYREDFFGRPSYLTVSGQLQVRDAGLLPSGIRVRECGDPGELV